jgi:arylsulfatase A-like enzyme
MMLLAFSCSRSREKQPEARPKNLLIVCLDTVRYDTFWLPETAGYSDSFTPWAERAIRFRQVQSPSSWTVPAISSVFTGLYPNQHGGGTFSSPVPNLDISIPNGLAPTVDTLAELLSRKRYRSIGFVSNPFIGPETGVLQGITRTRMMGTREIPPAASAWIQSYSAHPTPSPFFLYLHLMDAHSDHWLDRPRLTLLAQKVPPPLRTRIGRDAAGDICSDPDSDWCLRYATYVSTVLDTRRIVADLLDTLESTGLLDDTIVIVFSDHGEEFWEHAEEERRRSSDPRDMVGAGHGHAMWQEILQVPMLMWVPGQPGRDIDTRASLIDIPPTVAAWLDLPELEEWRGESLADLDALDQRRRLRERPLFSSGIAYGPAQTAVLSDRWKSVRHYCPPAEELFDIHADPREKAPVRDAPAAARAGKLKDGYEALPSLATGVAPTLGPDQIEKLRSLGYLQGRNSAATRVARCAENR